MYLARAGYQITTYRIDLLSNSYNFYSDNTCQRIMYKNTQLPIQKGLEMAFFELMTVPVVCSLSGP